MCINKMPKPLKHPYGLNPLRSLRMCLREKGRKPPISQGELAQILGTSVNNIRAYEAQQRSLPETLLLNAITKTGADWDRTKKRWVRFNSNPPEPFRRQHYDEF